MIELSLKIKKLIISHTKKRSKDLSFGSIFKNDRTYYQLNESSLFVLDTPLEILQILDEEGYYCPDYRKGYAYRKDDVLKNKPPTKILRVLSKKLIFKDKNKEKYDELKKKFETRLTANRKETINCKICITHNPFDVGLMSTNRNWTTCMNLYDGFYKTTPLKQIQYGGMCAYLIKESDEKVEEPIARIAIKRLRAKNKKDFIFVSENRIYGDEAFAKELKFDKNVNKILSESNVFTAGNSLEFQRRDRGSYSDSDLDKIYRFVFSSLTDMIQYIKKHKNLLKKESFYKGASLFDGFGNFITSDEFIKKFNDDIDWDYISQYQTLSYQFIEKYKNKVNWNNISEFQILTEDFIEKYKRKVNWICISEHQKLSEEFIEKHNRSVAWFHISKYQKLSEKFIKRHKERVTWSEICINQKLSESFIREFIRRIGWTEISEHQKLSEEFIEKYKNKLDWDHISAHQKLSENFIKKYKKLVNWENIFKYQKLSEEFKNEFSEKSPKN